jgi:PIN domain nuclease of toxin-antitoxin system
LIYLLDTCTFLWLCAEPARLSDTAKNAIEARGSLLLLSDVSAWEITLKWSKGKITLPDPPRHWFEEQVRAWALDCRPIGRTDLYLAGDLPDHHRDPFDRLLVASALNWNATILTPDPAVHRYPVSWRW